MKRIVLAIAALLLVLALGYGFTGNVMQGSGAPRGEIVREGYLAGIARLDSTARVLEDVAMRMNGDSASALKARIALAETRLAYKRVEFLSEQFSPETSRGLNGPVLDEVEEDDPNQIVVAPEGLQVIEEKLYADPAITGDSVREDIAGLRANIRRLGLLAAARELSDQNIFDAMLREVVRVMALGLAGFDSPIAATSVREAAAALEGMRDCYGVYASDLRRKDPRLDRRIDSLFAGAMANLESNPDFLGFDRLHFIRAYAKPLYSALHGAQRALGIPFPEDRRAISVTADSPFDQDAFDPLFFAPGYAVNATPAHAELGRVLFFDPVLSGNGRRACASCHRPELAFTDGMARSVAFDASGNVERNAPTLLNAGLQGSSFFDGRVLYLEDQATAVLANPAEMHGSLAASVQKLRHSSEYANLFARAYGPGEDVITNLNVRIALATYIRSLSSYNAPFDRYLRGENGALSESAKRGFNTFMGKAKCGTCHFMPLFNGAVPPTFAKTEMEILGVTATFDTLRPKLDADPGRFAVNRVEIQRHAFKTPTLRNVERTAPYMHNGAFATLEEVIDFYDHGGGAGMGLDVPNQTLPPGRLNLTEQEEADVIAFLKSLTDVSAAGTRPSKLPDLGDLASARRLGGEY